MYPVRALKKVVCLHQWDHMPVGVLCRGKIRDEQDPRANSINTNWAKNVLFWTTMLAAGPLSTDPKIQRLRSIRLHILARRTYIREKPNSTWMLLCLLLEFVPFEFGFSLDTQCSSQWYDNMDSDWLPDESKENDVVRYKSNVLKWEVRFRTQHGSCSTHQKALAVSRIWGWRVW